MYTIATEAHTEAYEMTWARFDGEQNSPKYA